MDKKELNAGRYLTTCFLVSVVLGLLLAGNSGGALSYVLTAVVIAIVAFFCLFWIGAIVAAVRGMSITGGPKGTPAPEPTAATAGTAPARRRRRRRRRKKKRATPEDIQYYDELYEEWHENWIKEQEEERKKRDEDLPKWIPF